MIAYIARRLLLALLTTWTISVLAFVIIQLPEGDAASKLLDRMMGNDAASDFRPEMAAELRSYLGLDRPMHVRYFMWLWNMTQGDFGRSYNPGVYVGPWPEAGERGDRRPAVDDGGFDRLHHPVHVDDGHSRSASTPRCGSTLWATTYSPSSASAALRYRTSSSGWCSCTSPSPISARTSAASSRRTTRPPRGALPGRGDMVKHLWIPGRRAGHVRHRRADPRDAQQPARRAGQALRRHGPGARARLPGGWS